MKKTLIIWLTTALSLVVFSFVLKILHLPLLTKTFVADILMIILFYLLNHYFFKQKILFDSYPIGKSIGLLGYSIYVLLVGVGMFLFSHGSPKAIPFALGAVIVGISEEFIFRGLILGSLVKSGKNMTFAILFSSLLFALLHAVNAFSQPLLNTVLQVIYVFPLGVLLAAVYTKSHNLILSIIMHAVQDFSAILNSGISSGRSVDTEAISKITSPAQVLGIYVIIGTIALLFILLGQERINLFREKIFKKGVEDAA